MKIISLRILLVLSLLLGFGTASSVGAEAPSETSPANLTIQQWTGHNFTFLTLAADKQAAGYEIFAKEQGEQGFQGDPSVRIPYTQHVGKQVTVTEVVPFSAGYNEQEYVVHMTVNETGEKLIGRSMRGQVASLVLTSDLDNARQQFLGKTIYPKFRQLSGTMDESVSTKIGGPATVVDVYTGNQTQEPIWLIVSVNGEKAVLPINYSWTNMPLQSWEPTSAWQDALFMQDPRMTLGGSPAVWNQIETGNVEESMTKGQVSLSWGKPVSIEQNDSIWIYGSKKLSFNGDVLHSIETLAASEEICTNEVCK